MRLQCKRQLPRAFALWACTAVALLPAAVALETTLSLNNGGVAVTNNFDNLAAGNEFYNAKAAANLQAAAGNGLTLATAPAPSGAGLAPADSLAFAFAPSGNNGVSVGGSLASANASPPSLPSFAGAGTWGESTALHLARQDFQAMLLEQGPLKDRVLAVGGCCKGAGSLSSSELFTPANNSWTTTGDLQSPRWLFQAVALSNGSALALGGLSIARGGVLNSTEMFLPFAGGGGGTWLEVAAMNTPRQDFQAVLLDGGEVLAAGGFNPTSEMYDPKQDQWTQTSRMAMAEARSSFQMVKLGGGKVLAAGGRGRNSAVTATSELFDPATRTWTAQGSMTEPRAYFAAVLMADGRVLAAGGKNDRGMNLNSTEIFDPSTGEWKAAGNMKYQRSEMQGVTLPSGRVLVVGGLGGEGATDTGILDTAEIYDPAGDRWTPTDPMQAGRYVFQLVELANGTCMAIGGTGTSGFTTSTELFQTA